MAFMFYAQIKGQKQGAIDGDVTQKGREKTILCSALEHLCESPRDIQSGLPTGKRRYHPLRITKAVDGASPMLWNALVNNENLTEATFKFFRASKAGVEEHFYTIKLTNANIASIVTRQLNMHEMENAKIPMEEEVAFTFQKIEWDNLASKKTASDDWEAPVS
jgi:type VI secretion system secreted protein Hcp